MASTNRGNATVATHPAANDAGKRSRGAVSVGCVPKASNGTDVDIAEPVFRQGDTVVIAIQHPEAARAAPVLNWLVPNNTPSAGDTGRRPLSAGGRVVAASEKIRTLAMQLNGLTGQIAFVDNTAKPGNHNVLLHVLMSTGSIVQCHPVHLSHMVGPEATDPILASVASNPLTSNDILHRPSPTSSAGVERKTVPQLGHGDNGEDRGNHLVKNLRDKIGIGLRHQAVVPPWTGPPAETAADLLAGGHGVDPKTSPALGASKQDDMSGVEVLCTAEFSRHSQLQSDHHPCPKDVKGPGKRKEQLSLSMNNFSGDDLALNAHDEPLLMWIPPSNPSPEYEEGFKAFMSTLEANSGPLKVAVDDALQELQKADYNFEVASAALVPMNKDKRAKDTRRGRSFGSKHLNRGLKDMFGSGFGKSAASKVVAAFSDDDSDLADMDKAKEWAGANFGDHHTAGAASQEPVKKRPKSAHPSWKAGAPSGKAAVDEGEIMSKPRGGGAGRKTGGGGPAAGRGAASAGAGSAAGAAGAGPRGKNNRERCMSKYTFGPLTIVRSSLSASGYQGVYSQKATNGLPQPWRSAAIVHGKWTQIGLFSTALIAAQAYALFQRDSSLHLPCSEGTVLRLVVELTGSSIGTIPDHPPSAKAMTNPATADRTGPVPVAVEHAPPNPAGASKHVRPKQKAQKATSGPAFAQKAKALKAEPAESELNNSNDAFSLPRLQRVASTREGEEMDFVDGDSPPVSLRGESDDEMMMN